ncbi:tRNA-dihydrouridine(16/17) synthase [NAD(P)(+)]-like [Aedes aegypti]|uniref:tRNA-dihydrouridine(16/17) synthase [NAD(P)(+)]-like n=1 Tax=Aedes aegypti TaxID=7159 RepID=A0A6I8T604_AEDAE|nr:tRNA-dihydrouridine(16/17) synthase [NAD(P)(+)]-like [Aedes aegypti]XP_021703403.1 tRNA-dihydrouridine(16/17) synthase [NAD(P)(+)]-like [Aedes aegypti]XP_021703404.1 tRNA-dihydrouridine(16/17) synthase [NAD(P)(+)]-like [Aedes aegypti]XP_021703405.1 tRNA-dihydrouridine(16/17) synthase [NAD(P)(+)]-like [Aedes aegypti]
MVTSHDDEGSSRTEDRNPPERSTLSTPTEAEPVPMETDSDICSTDKGNTAVAQVPEATSGSSPSASARGKVESASQRPKLTGFEFYEKTLGSPKYVVAPMVDASELAWRLLSRRHGAQLCYSPMFHSSCFSKDPKYRKDSLQTCPEDRPLIIQFCGNDPKVLLEAALLAQDHCDAIDINLGCPQAIAKRGHYGAFLQDEWDLLKEIVSTLHSKLSVPVTCKIRIFEDMNKTIRYAKMLEAAGCQMLTVHGRTRDQKGPLTGIADWKYVKKLKEILKIPVLSNGNIMGVEDVHRCMEETGVNGIMTAEGNLFNPFLFEGVNPTAWSVALEYLDIVEQYPAPMSYIRGHLFKILHHLMNLKPNAVLRERMASCHSVSEFRAIVKEIEAKYAPIHEGLQQWSEEESSIPQASPELTYNLSLPPWLCQPYIRAPPEVHRQKLQEATQKASDPNREKRKFYDPEGNEISHKKMKKIRRVQRRPNRAGLLPGDPGREPGRRFDEICKNEKIKCINPMGMKCEHKLCRVCCKNHCFHADLDCSGHKIFIKSRRHKAKTLTELERQAAENGNEDGQQRNGHLEKMDTES